MPIRHKHKVGDWLLVDDESGIVNYRSKMTERWDGLMVRKDQYETRQPQEFVKAKTDPKAVNPIRPATAVALPSNNIPHRVGLSDVLTKLNGPAAHLFDVNFRIGPTGIASTTAFGNVDFNPTGVVFLDLEDGGIAHTNIVNDFAQISIGTDLGIGDMEIGPSFEVR